MEVCQPLTEAANISCNAILQLARQLQALRATDNSINRFEDFEHTVNALFNQAQQDFLAEALTDLDIDAPAIEIEGICYKRVLRSHQNYQTAVGPVRIMRTLYRNGKEKCIVPLDLKAGIVEGFWTPRAAKQVAWIVAQMPPGEAKRLFELIGGMSPSESSLTRFPSRFNEQWEQHRGAFEDIIIEQLKVPENAVAVATSLDGVMLPMKDGKRREKRAKSASEGKRPQGPAGCKEASCGTLSFYNAQGDRLSTIRIGRMPETKKLTLKQSLKALLQEAVSQNPELSIVKVADGAKDNWSYLSHELPAGVEVVDFYHAAEHLKKAFDQAYGENSPKSKEKFTTYRHILKDEPDGVDRVINALAYQRRKYPRRSKLKTELEYFRNNRQRMRYAENLANNLPIGSGVVEAACKTLVTQRMKCSGMRWRNPGGQGVLTIRSLIQSGWFENGWNLLAATYCVKVNMATKNNVIPLGLTH